MATILIKPDQISEDVINFIYEKQSEFKKEKNRCVSLASTIEMLLKKAYEIPKKSKG